MPRHARLDAPGTLHHVIARGIDRTIIFTNNADRARFLAIIEELVVETGTKIPAWSIMHNHFHLLVLSGPAGLPAFMRRLMTKYAVYFNRKHHRTGHLFQNRYKSIICEEEPYFLELVRYIHLNPLRGGLVGNLGELDAYPWCGHSAIIGRRNRVWQDSAAVLRHFGETPEDAVRLYRAFLDEGKERGKQPELSGGGLKRSAGGTIDRNDRAAYDARILGSGDFVERVLNRIERRPSKEPVNTAAVVARICGEYQVNEEQLRNGSRRRPVSEARQRIIDELVNGHGVSLGEVALLTGISPSGVENVLRRARKE